MADSPEQLETQAGSQVESQVERGLMVYPESGWRWLFFRAPMWFWRMGLGSLMGFRFCVLTVYGRKSGEPRHTILEWVEDGGRLHVGAGWGPRSQWVKNVLANPAVTVQSGMGTIRGRAVRMTDGDVMRRLYPHMKKSPVWEQYCASWGVDGKDPEDVAAKAGQLWTFVIEPCPGQVPPVMQSDLWWVPMLVGLVLLVPFLL
jgi:deazaflavin-dependent oxidoreductase (nitroreductase family)